ncbi:MAG: hypothetical protein ABR568_24420, partial [Pyrinomonadaceae bacterium]
MTTKSDTASGAKGTLTPGSGTPELTADPARSAASNPLNAEKTVAPPTALSTPPSAHRKQPLRATVSMVYR